MAPEPRTYGDVARRVSIRSRRLRQAAQMTETDLAARMTAAGAPIRRQGVNAFENGWRGLSVDDLVALAHALGTSPAALLDESCGHCGNEPPPGYSCRHCGTSGSP